MISILSFLALIVIVVSIHELGHYFAARMCGVKVLRFSLGFGRPLFSRFDRAGTEWVVAPIPLGGYVSPLSEREAVRRGLPRSKAIEGQSPLRQIFIYAAGPFMNLVLAFVILVCFNFGDNLRFGTTVGHIAENSPISLSTINSGDKILQINDVTVTTWKEMQKEIVKSTFYEQPVTIFADSGAATISVGTFNRDNNFEYEMGFFPKLPAAENVVASVDRKSNAAQAGILPGDIIRVVNGERVSDWNEVIAAFPLIDGRENVISLERDSKIHNLTMIFDKANTESGYLGISPKFDKALFEQVAVTVNYSLGEAIIKSATNLLHVTALSFIIIYNIIVGDMSFIENIGGPISIAGLAGDAAREGVRAWFALTLGISMSLMVINLLPIPLLDGGRILLAFMELVYRKPLPKAFSGTFNFVGGLIIFALMVTTFAIDLARL